ncbi:RecX family transcriptional regulator [Candidatus Saccharibacteria bacterium]|nr:RecX family transcriptional regulator [Candidatus Saccharibacteria bacterium]
MALEVLSVKDDLVETDGPFAPLSKKKRLADQEPEVRKITALKAGVKDKTRVNVFMGGQYSFSLALSQVVDSGIKVGVTLSEEEEARLRTESEFGKAYTKALEWALSRPHSTKELDDYLFRKSMPKSRLSHDKSGKAVMKEYSGMHPAVAERVREALVRKGYVDNEKFARCLIETWRYRKGVSRRGIMMKLKEKGVDQGVAERILDELNELGRGRDDAEEIQKIIAKKRRKYDDHQLVGYLVRQGFSYDDVKKAVCG